MAVMKDESTKNGVKVGAVKWHMQPVAAANDFFARVRFFVKTLAEIVSEHANQKSRPMRT
jgi:hypothetical protein